jgi:hypothetical protein
MARERRVVPKKRQRHHSYDESVDEPVNLLDQEPVETEREIPAEDTEVIERVEPENDGATPFED